MSVAHVREYLKHYQLDSQILEFSSSSATVELASQQLGCEPARIAKTLSFFVNQQPILIVMAGDAKIDNVKFKQLFQSKAKMISSEQVETIVGHAVGGVCPFAINEKVEVYLDESLKRFSTVFPACGSSNSVIELNLSQLEMLSHYKSWIDVGKNWQDIKV